MCHLSVDVLVLSIFQSEFSMVYTLFVLSMQSMHWKIKLQRHQGYVVVIVAFSFYTDLGTSVFLAWTGFYGTLLPVANCWLMFLGWGIIQRHEGAILRDEFFFGGLLGVIWTASKVMVLSAGLSLYLGFCQLLGFSSFHMAPPLVAFGRWSLAIATSLSSSCHSA